MPRDIEQLDHLLMDVQDEVPGCPDQLILKELGRAARIFCTKTECWTKKVNCDVVADQLTYSPVLRENARILRVIGVKIKISSSDVFEDLSAVDQDQYKVVDSESIEFIHSSYAPDYSISDGMEIEVALRPTLSNAELPLDIIDQYGHAIAARARVYLQARPGKLYSNPQGATDNLFIFNEALTDALSELRGREGKKEQRGLSA